jgi:hypothetical protein
MSENNLDAKDRMSLTIIMYNIFFVNDVAMSYIFDALTELKNTKLYKGSVKYRTKIVETYMKRYNALLEKRSKMVGFIADVNDRMNDEVQGDLIKLELTSKNILEKHHVHNSTLMAKMSVAYTLCNAACANIKYATSYDSRLVRYTKHFRVFNLKELTQSFDVLSTIVEKENYKESAVKYTCDLNGEYDLQNGFAIVIRKLKDPKTILKILEEIENEKKSEKKLEY